MCVFMCTPRKKLAHMRAGLKDYFCGIARRLLPYSIACTIQEHKVARTSTERKQGHMFRYF